METPSSTLELLIERLEQFAKTNIELSKLKAIEIAATIASLLISRLCFVGAIALFTIFLNIGIALMLGDMIGKVYYGFFIVATFYLMAGIVFYFFLNKWIKKPLSDMIITQALQ